MGKNCSIYGPDLTEHEAQGKQIADLGLKCMKGVGSPSKEEKSDGDEVSKNNLEKFKPSNP
jgi:hypothetical protein